MSHSTTFYTAAHFKVPPSIFISSFVGFHCTKESYSCIKKKYKSTPGICCRKKEHNCADGIQAGCEESDIIVIIIIIIIIIITIVISIKIPRNYVAFRIKSC